MPRMLAAPQTLDSVCVRLMAAAAEGRGCAVARLAARRLLSPLRQGAACRAPAARRLVYETLIFPMMMLLCIIMVTRPSGPPQALKRTEFVEIKLSVVC